VQLFRDLIQSMLETMPILKGMLASGGSAGLTPRRFRRGVKMQANFEKHVQEQAVKLKARNEELINEQNRLSRLRSRQQAQFTLEGKLVGEAEVGSAGWTRSGLMHCQQTYRNNPEERQKLVVQLAGTVLPLEDDQIDLFRRRL
jgi:hypothetical protein